MKSTGAVQKLEKAYFDLLEDVHYSKITVSDIISKAGVSRTTFYRHYVDIFDMHERIAEKLGNAIIEKCVEKVFTSKTEEECFDVIVEVFNSQDKYINLISGENGSRYFFETLFFISQKDLLPEFINVSEEQFFRLRFMMISAIGSYVKDVLENRPHNPKYITLCKKLVSFNELLGGYYE